jgi:cholesterol transport system auxiliary component
MILSRRSFVSSMALSGLSACGALSAASEASAPLDTYTLASLAPDGTPSSRAGHLVVELPTAGGALGTDRILIKPTPLQAQYLPDARWSDPVPALVQTLLVGSLLNRGSFRLVSRVGAGLMPDYTLMTEIQTFQAEFAGADGATAQVRIAMRMTLIREADRAIAAIRPVAAAVPTASDSTLALVEGFDSAMQMALSEIVGWVAAET